MKKQKSNLIILGLLPLVLVLAIIYFINGTFGPLQSLAHKAFASILALSVLFVWLRFQDVLLGIDFKKDITNVEPHQRIVYARTRLVVSGCIIGAIFALA